MTTVSLSSELDGRIAPSFGEAGSSFSVTPSGLSQTLHVIVPGCGNQHVFAHRLWRAGLLLADLIASEEIKVRGRRVLELGAGVGLPGITAALCGASETLLTDYDDAQLIFELRENVKANILPDQLSHCRVAPHTWSKALEDLIDSHGTFDDVLCADVLWDIHSHEDLVKTITALLSRSAASRVHFVGGFHTGRRTVERAFDRLAFRGLVLDDALPATEVHVVTGESRPWAVGKEDEPIAERNQWLMKCRLQWREDLL